MGCTKRIKVFPDEARQLVDNILKEEKIFAFIQAEVNGKIPYDAEVLKKVHEKTSFWKRDYDKLAKEIDMTHIQFAVAKELKNNDDENFLKNF